MDSKLSMDLESAIQSSHRQLVQRIVASRNFVKSPRLSSFLVCVCDLVHEGTPERINEHHIGTTVFHRKADYDQGADSIVRSHASRLRQQLARYFSEEGTGEEWILTIPKGSYVPAFHRRCNLESPSRIDAAEALQADSPTVMDSSAVSEPLASYEQLSNTLASRTVFKVLSLALAAMAVSCCGFALWAVRAQHSVSKVASGSSEGTQVFWARLFNAQTQTVVVTADSGLVMLQQLTKQRVSLPAYMDGTYLSTAAAEKFQAKELLDLGTRRYTTTVDLLIMNKILRMPGIDIRNTRFVYSRDLMPGDIKKGNMVLLGTYESTPWVQLFEPEMNFHFENDLARGVFSAVNRHPLQGEQATYDSLVSDPKRTIYGEVAYRPSLDGAGKTLILEGHTMAGTEAASDFVFNDGSFLPFLQSILRTDGTVPYFEVLVRSTNLRGQSARIEIIAERTEDH